MLYLQHREVLCDLMRHIQVSYTKYSSRDFYPRTPKTRLYDMPKYHFYLFPLLFISNYMLFLFVNSYNEAKDQTRFAGRWTLVRRQYLIKS